VCPRLSRLSRRCTARARAQLWIQTFDLDEDAAAGRRTTAVRLGLRGAQAVLLVLLLGETAFVHAHFTNWPLRSFSAASVALLGAQAVLTGGATPNGKEKDRRATSMSPASVNAVFLVLGVGGVGLMVRVWLDAAFA
jgi:1,4-dihydroxy-2-naphthoate octaprenyltransferase